MRSACGFVCLTEADTAKALGLTATQSAKMKVTMETGQKKQQELLSGLRGAFGGRSSGGEKGAKKTERKRPSREDIQKRFADMQSKGTVIRAETDKAIASVLTAGQKTKFETRRIKMIEHQDMLTTQMNENKSKHTSEMDDRERQMNRDLLKKVTEDKDLLNALQKRLTATQKSQKMKRSASTPL